MSTDTPIPPTAEQNTPKTITGLTESTHSSRSSAERYRLDEFDTRPILLYRYRGKLETSSQERLCAQLEKDESLRVTKKPIPRYTSYVNVQRHDLFLPEEQELYRDLPNYDSSLASIKIPTLAYFSRIMLGNYSQLYIVSPETSPASSVADQESHRHTSPASTWGKDSEEDVKAASQ